MTAQDTSSRQNNTLTGLTVGIRVLRVRVHPTDETWQMFFKTNASGKARLRAVAVGKCQASFASHGADEPCQHH